MKNLLFTIVAGSLFFLSSCVRDRNVPAPRDPVREYVFTEEFNNDRNGWSFADPANLAYGVVSNGTFKFDYNDNYFPAYYVAQFVGFNPYDDFSIAARIGSDNNMGLLFGYDDSKNSYGYSFMVDYDGYFALYDEGGNGYGEDIEVVVEPQTNRYVNYNGDWNDLFLEQRGGRWIGYVNDVQVFNIPAQRMRGTGLGFVVVSQTQGEADYIEAHWLQ